MKVVLNAKIIAAVMLVLIRKIWEEGDACFPLNFSICTDSS
jgi:hypothetical protein